jgi:hypothetical protein
MNDTEFRNCLLAMGAKDSERPLPTADALWWRAELSRRLAAEERAIRPVRIVERLACAACLLGAVVLAAVRF